MIGKFVNGKMVYDVPRRLHGPFGDETELFGSYYDAADDYWGGRMLGGDIWHSSAVQYEVYNPKAIQLVEEAMYEFDVISFDDGQLADIKNKTEEAWLKRKI